MKAIVLERKGVITIRDIGIPPDGIMPLDIVAAQAKELVMVTIFRYANMYPRAIELLSTGAVNIGSFVSRRFPFSRGIEAINYALNPPKDTVKCVIEMEMIS